MEDDSTIKGVASREGTQTTLLIKGKVQNPKASQEEAESPDATQKVKAIKKHKQSYAITSKNELRPYSCIPSRNNNDDLAAYLCGGPLSWQLPSWQPIFESIYLLGDPPSWQPMFESAYLLGSPPSWQPTFDAAYLRVSLPSRQPTSE